MSQDRTMTHEPVVKTGNYKEDHKAEMQARKERRENSDPVERIFDPGTRLWTPHKPPLYDRSKYIPAGVNKNIGEGFSLSRKI